MVTFIPMSEIDFVKYMSYATQNYANEKVRAGTWLKSEAMKKSEEEFKKLLPNGVQTDHQYLYKIVSQANEQVGYFWFYFDDQRLLNEAFIYDFLIFENQQGKHYGKEAITVMDHLAANMGIDKISLHVFAHNEKAINLYKSTGYHTADLVMTKTIQ